MQDNVFVRVVASVMYQVGTAITFNCDWEQRDDPSEGSPCSRTSGLDAGESHAILLTHAGARGSTGTI